MRFVVLAVAAFLSVATSAPRHSYPRDYATWRVSGAGDDVWVSKSGKEGFGISALRKDIVAGRFTTGGMTFDALPPIHDTETTIYLGFVFDNERLWDAGINEGQLELTLAGGEKLVLPMVQRRDAPHRRIDRYAPEPVGRPRRGGEPAMPMVPR